MNNRQNGRRRGRGGQPPRSGQPGGQDRGNRIDNRARGNAAQMLEKYKSLARDAHMQDDRVNTEYYLQFADHYFRVLSESRSRFDEQRPTPARRDDFGQDGDDDQDVRGIDQQGDGQSWNEGDEDRQERPPQSQQPQGQQPQGQQPQGQQPQRRQERQDRQPRDQRPQRDGQAERADRRDMQREGQPEQRDGQRDGQRDTQRDVQRDDMPTEQRDIAATDAGASEMERPAPRAERPRRGRPPRQPVEADGEARIEIDRLPAGFAPVAAASAPVPSVEAPVPAPMAADEAPAATDGEGEAPRPRRRAPRKPRSEATVDA